MLDTGLGKVYFERRNGGDNIYCRTHIKGGYKLHNTKKLTLAEARTECARWFQRLYAEAQTKAIHGHKFKDVADACVKWIAENKRGELSDGQIRNIRQKWDVLSGAKADKPQPWHAMFDNLNIEDI